MVLCLPLCIRAVVFVLLFLLFLSLPLFPHFRFFLPLCPHLLFVSSLIVRVPRPMFLAFLVPLFSHSLFLFPFFRFRLLLLLFLSLYIPLSVLRRRSHLSFLVSPVAQLPLLFRVVPVLSDRCVLSLFLFSFPLQGLDASNVHIFCPLLPPLSDDHHP